MKFPRPLQMALLIYEVLRLSLILKLSLEGVLAGGGLLPAAANALYPLMAFFLWLNPPVYGAFRPLYMAGKCAAVAAGLGWLLFSFQGAAVSLLGGASRLILCVFALLAADALSVLASAALRGREARAAASTAAAEEQAGPAASPEGSSGPAGKGAS